MLDLDHRAAGDDLVVRERLRKVLDRRARYASRLEQLEPPRPSACVSTGHGAGLGAAMATKPSAVANVWNGTMD